MALYGVIGGVVFSGVLTPREEGHLVAASAVATLVISLAAWFAWVPVQFWAQQLHSGFWAAILENFLVALFVTGFVGLIVGLVPYAFFRERSSSPGTGASGPPSLPSCFL